MLGIDIKRAYISDIIIIRPGSTETIRPCNASAAPMAHLLQDLRNTLRMWRHAPVFVLVSGLTLGSVKG